MLRCLLLLLAVMPPALACRCEISLSACNEVEQSNLVFIGTVQSIEPAFLSRWNLKAGAPLERLNEADASARQHPSIESLLALKTALRAVLPEMPEEARLRLEAASAPAVVMALFDTLAERGLKAHFKVRTLFRHADDDRKDADDDGDQDAGSVDVSTPFGDCGVDFQIGETYLVYANSEEGSDTFFTGSCTRTRRLTDAGEDLAYLYFYKDDRANSARLEGFATTDPRYQLDFNSLRNPESIAAPATGSVIELQNGQVTRDAAADHNGRFFFDGLPGGDYTISAYAGGYPSTTHLLAGPEQVRIEPKSCGRRVLLLRKSD